MRDGIQLGRWGRSDTSKMMNQVEQNRKDELERRSYNNLHNIKTKKVTSRFINNIESNGKHSKLSKNCSNAMTARIGYILSQFQTIH